MKSAISIMMFAALLAGCGHNHSSVSAPSDAQIRQGIVGAWQSDTASTNTVTFKSDGTLSSQNDDGKGTWTVTNGVLIVIEDGPDGEADTNKVVRIDDHECVLQEVESGDVTTLSKR